MATLETSRKLGGMARMLVQSSLMSEEDAAVLQEKSHAQKVSFLAATLTQKKNLCQRHCANSFKCVRLSLF